MATELYAQFKLANGGIVQTNSKAPGDESDNWLKIIQFDHGMFAPVSQDDGIQTGERRHDPMVFHAGLEKSAPYFMNAVSLGKESQFSEVVVRYYTGDLTHYQTTAITGAKCISVKPRMYNYKDPEYAEHPHILTFEMRYEAIAWYNKQGNHGSSDAWIGGDDGEALRGRATAIASAGQL